MGKKKTSDFTKKGVENLANAKPVVYSIESKTGKTLYVGSAKRGRVPGRLSEHLPGRKDAVRGGQQVRIQQYRSIKDAQQAEARAIKRKQPPQNREGK